MLKIEAKRFGPRCYLLRLGRQGMLLSEAEALLAIRLLEQSIAHPQGDEHEPDNSR
jgi:hypothetical protein